MTKSHRLASEERIEEIGSQVPLLKELRGKPLVFVSSVTIVDPNNGIGEAEFAATLASARSSRQRQVPHIFMVGETSDPEVFTALKSTGAIVVPVPDEEKGLWLPYAIASQLVDRYAGPDTIMCKVEGAKNLAANLNNIGGILAAGWRHDVVVGFRSQATWESMPFYQGLTESLLRWAISAIVPVPDDVASGVLILNARGRELLREFDGTDWGYLITVPLAARRLGLRVGSVEVDFEYHPAVVAFENGNPQADAKRRDQIIAMIARAVLAAGGLHNLTTAVLLVHAIVMDTHSALTKQAAWGRSAA